MKVLSRLFKPREGFYTYGPQQEDDDGFSLIELIMTIAIMGMILFIINVILIAITKSSARSDATIRLRQLLEFGFEVIERNAQSADPDSICIAQYNELLDQWECSSEITGDAVRMSVLGSGGYVVFYLEETDDEIGILKSFWEDDESTVTFLTNSGEIDVESFEIDIAHDYSTGTHEMIVRIVCDSITRLEGAEPLVDDMLRTVNIVTKGKEV